MSPVDELPTVILSCQVLEGLLSRLLPEGLAHTVTYMDYGLHRVPDKMRCTLQAAIDDLQEPSLVVLGYGLCGNGLHGLRSGPHTLLVPRVDDCIALLLGSREAYFRQFEAVPGTYYLSRGWLESGSHPLKEYQEYTLKYGPAEAEWIMDQQYQHYERLVLVAHDQAELEACRPQAREVARFCQRWDMRYEELLGSDCYVRRIIEVAGNLDHLDKDLLLFGPGETIEQGKFLL